MLIRSLSVYLCGGEIGGLVSGCQRAGKTRGSLVVVAVLACLGGLAPGGSLALRWEGGGQRAWRVRAEPQLLVRCPRHSTDRTLGRRGLHGLVSSEQTGRGPPQWPDALGAHSSSPHGLRGPIILVTDGSENASQSRPASGERPACLCPGTGGAGTVPPVRPTAGPVSRP